MPLSDSRLRSALGNEWFAWRDGKPIGEEDLKFSPQAIDVTLGNHFTRVMSSKNHIDPRRPESMYTEVVELDDDSPFLLSPGELVLGCVREAFACSAPLKMCSDWWRFWEWGKETYFYPVYDGRSTTARIGISSHCTSGRGDWGFGDCGETFTLELSALEPVLLWPAMRIGQIYFEPIIGKPTHKYQGAYAGCISKPISVPASLGPLRF
jgi:dCTP deaminase